MTLSIALLVFPGVQALDLIGPYEVFAALGESSVRLVWKTREPVRSSAGLMLQAQETFADCTGPLDVLCVPGGAGVNALMEDDATLRFVAEAAARARTVTSVCTGALVLGAAGLLRGRRATTHWAAHDLLARFGAVPTKARVVQDGNVITGGGVTAGIDFALTVAAELVGREAAEAAQLYLEYAPAPPFRAGSPEEAPEAVLAAARARFAPIRRERERIIESISRARA